MIFLEAASGDRYLMKSRDAGCVLDTSILSYFGISKLDGSPKVKLMQ